MSDCHSWSEEHDQTIFDNITTLSFTEIGRLIGGLTKHHVRGRWLRLKQWYKKWKAHHKRSSVVEFLRELHSKPEPEPTSEGILGEEDLSIQVGGDKQIVSVSQIDTARDDKGALEVALERAKVDLEVWEVDTWKAKRYQGFFRNHSLATGKKSWERTAKVVTMWSVSITLKKRTATPLENLESTKKEMMAELKKAAPKYRAVTYPHVSFGAERFAAELFIPDAHHGKLAWAPETGTNYDSSISRGIYADAVNHLIGRVHGLPLEKIFYVLGNDFFHTDTPTDTTTAGTKQDTDSRWKKTFMRMREVVVNQIEMLRTIAPVNVIIVPGNHDETRMFYLGDALECRFHNCDDVIVDNTPPMRKYAKYGNTLLGWSHGDKEKIVDYPMLMAHEAKQLFSACQYYEWHIGHLHKRQEVQRAIVDQVNTDTIDGVVVRRIPALCGTDFWHHQHGYSLNPRQADLYLWSDQRAYAGHFCYSYFGEKG